MRMVLRCRPHGLKFDLGWKFILATVVAFGLTSTGDRITLAAEVEFLDGQVTGAFDTTISLGVSVRVEDRDDALVGIGNGGTATSLNVDDGNLNYKAGDITSAAGKVTHELELQWRNFEFFGRGFYFYDVLITDTERTKLSETAEGRSVRDIKLLGLHLQLESGYFWLFITKSKKSRTFRVKYQKITYCPIITIMFNFE